MLVIVVGKNVRERERERERNAERNAGDARE